MSAAFEPAPLRPRRRLDRGLVALLVVGLLVGLAWLKPWSAGERGHAQAGRASSPQPAVQLAPSAARAATPSPSTAQTSAGPLTAAQRRAKLVDRIVGALAPAAGSWGVGAGGWSGTPGDATGGAALASSVWSSWNAIHPDGAPPPLAKAAQRCVGTGSGATRGNVVPAGPYLLAITVPAGVTPDWRVAAVRRVDGRTEDLTPVLRQVSPPGNRGIAYLFRTDDRPWPGGLYRFRILGPVETVALDVCVASASPG